MKSQVFKRCLKASVEQVAVLRCDDNNDDIMISCCSLSIAAGFTGWMSYLISMLLHHHTDLVHGSTHVTNNRRNITLPVTFLSIAAAIAVFLLGKALPI